MSIKKRTTIYFLGLLLPILIVFATTPFYILQIGQKNYGILIIIWTALSYLAFLDLGSGKSLVYYVSKLGVGYDSNTEVREYFWSGLLQTIFISALASFTIFILYFIGVANYFSIDSEVFVAIEESAGLILVGLPIVALTTFFVGALQANDDFTLISCFNIANVILAQIAPVLTAMFYSLSLKDLIASVIYVRLFSLVVMFFFCLSVYGAQITFCMQKCVTLLRYGLWATSINIVSPAFIILDKFLIVAIGGAVDLARYTVPFQLTSKLSLVPQAITDVLFTEMARSNNNVREYLAAQSIGWIGPVVTGISCIGITLSNLFISNWIDHAFALNVYTTANVLIVAYWISAHSFVSYTLLAASGKQHNILYIQLLELPLYIALVWWLTSRYGILGTAGALCLRNFMDMILLCRHTGTLAVVGKLLAFESILIGLSLYVSFNYKNNIYLCTVWILIILITSTMMSPAKIKNIFRVNV